MAIYPTEGRKYALDEFLGAKLREGFGIETHTDSHAMSSKGNPYWGDFDVPDPLSATSFRSTSTAR